MEKTPPMLHLQDLLREAMVTRRAIRFYEQQGLLLPAGRDRRGRRIYAHSDLLRLKLIRALREAGLPVDAIRQVLESRTIQTAEDLIGASWLRRMENVLAHFADLLAEQLSRQKTAEEEVRKALTWLTEHRDDLTRESEDAPGSPPERLLATDAVPLIARALLTQPPCYVISPAKIPPKKPPNEQAPQREKSRAASREADLSYFQPPAC